MMTAMFIDPHKRMALVVASVIP